MTVTLEDGSLLEGDLLVGADGIHSAVRSLIFGPESDFFYFLGFHVAAYYIEDVHLGALVGDRVAATDTRNESMFFYRLRDGRTAVLAVHRTDDPALPPDARTLLRTRYRKLGWICPEALAAMPGRLLLRSGRADQDALLAQRAGGPARGRRGGRIIARRPGCFPRNGRGLSAGRAPPAGA